MWGHAHCGSVGEGPHRGGRHSAPGGWRRSQPCCRHRRSAEATGRYHSQQRVAGRKPQKAEGPASPHRVTLMFCGNCLVSACVLRKDTLPPHPGRADPGETHVHPARNWGSGGPGDGAQNPEPKQILSVPQCPWTVSPPNTHGVKQGGEPHAAQPSPPAWPVAAALPALELVLWSPPHLGHCAGIRGNQALGGAPRS